MEVALYQTYTSGDEAQELTSTEHSCQRATGYQQDSKIQAAWDTVKTNFSRRPSLTKAWRRWSRSSVTDQSQSEDLARKSQDKEDGLFCDALLGLMQRTGRYDYFDYSRDTTREERKEFEAK